MGVGNPNGGARDLSIVAAQMAAGYFPGGTSEGLIPRRDGVYLNGSFGPSVPATPTAIDAPMGGMNIPRRWQYPVGYNLPSPPGATKPIDFRVLEQIADVYDVLRRCIEVRKQELATMRWEILPRDQDLTKPGVKRPAEMDKRIGEITAFFACPDPINGIEIGDWLKMALEEVFVKDALSIFPHPTWLPGKGVNGSSLFALEILDGKTIKPLLDIRGARPLPPNPAYQQFIWGIPRSEMEAQYSAEGAPLADPDAKTFIAAGGGENGEYPALYYKIYNRRTYSAYGFSNVEQIVLNVNLALKRQQFHTAFFTDGTIPAGIVMLPEDFAPTAPMVREFEEGWNQLLSGDMAWKHKIRALPGAAKFEQLKPSYLGTQEVDFDRWLALLTCMGMDVTTMEIGLGPSTTGGLGGKGYGDAEENITERKSLRPLMHFFKGFFDHVLVTWMHAEDLEFRFIHEEAEDELKRAQVDQILIETGQKTQNEGRVERGLDPYDDGVGDDPIIITRQGPVKLSDLDALSKQAAGLNPDGSPKPDPALIRAQQMGTSNPRSDPNSNAEGDKLSAADLRKQFESELDRLTLEELEKLVPTLRESQREPVVIPAPVVHMHVPEQKAPIVKVAAPVVNVPPAIVNVEAAAPVEQLDLQAFIDGIGQKFAEANANRGELEIVRDKYRPEIVTGVRRKKPE